MGNVLLVSLPMVSAYRQTLRGNIFCSWGADPHGEDLVLVRRISTRSKSGEERADGPPPSLVGRIARTKEMASGTMETHEFFSGNRVKICFWNKTRNTKKRDPLRVLRDPAEDVGGLLRSRTNDKDFAEIKYAEDGSLPDPITEEDMFSIRRPLLSDGVQGSEKVEVSTEKFVQIFFDLVLDPDSDGLCNLRVHFGGIKDTHPSGKELMTRIKDMRLVMRKGKDDRAPAVVISVAAKDSGTSMYGTPGADFEFPNMRFSSFTQSGDILVHSMIPDDMHLSLVVTMEESALPLITVDGKLRPPSAIASELYLNDEAKSLLSATPLTMELEGDIILKTEDGCWVCPEDQTGGVFAQDPIVEVDYRLDVIQAVDPGDGSGDEGGSTSPYFGFQSFPGAVHVVRERGCERIKQIGEKVGDDPDEMENDVRLAGGVSDWIRQVLGHV